VKKLLNTLYVTTEGASLCKDGENLVAEIDGAERARVPLHMLASVVVFGATFVSPPLIQACARAGITIVLLDRARRFQARIEGPVNGNVLLRREQYRVSDKPDDIVRSIVSDKVANQRTVLQRTLRDHGHELAADRREAIEAAVLRLGMILQRVGLFEDGAEVLRGEEGEAGRIYFGVFNDLIRVLDADIVFRGRSRRPPLDPVNALLSFFTRYSSTIAAAWRRASDWTRPSAFCIEIGLDAPASRSISWRNCVPPWPTGWGAWIETLTGEPIPKERVVAPRAGAWIETDALQLALRWPRVAPRAGAWIETSVCAIGASEITCRSPRGGVDRNCLCS
jgi:CRISPR associated protein Cas1